MKKKNRSLLVWGCVSAGVVVLLTTATILATTTFRSILTTVLGGPSPIMAEGVEAIYTSDYATKEESKEAGDALNKQIAEEGSVLLLNEKSALPLAQNERKVSVFGKNSVNLVLGGSGSGGGISGDTAKTIYDGLEAAGIEYNPVLKSFYESSESGSVSIQRSSWTIMTLRMKSLMRGMPSGRVRMNPGSMADLSARSVM